MYQYKYVKATMGGLFTKAKHREVIDKNAKEGWRLVQVLPTSYNGHGRPTEYDIIFEQKIGN